MSATAPPRRGLRARLAAIDDGAIMRLAFTAMLAGTITMLVLDYRALSADAAAMTSETAPLRLLPVLPNLPGFTPGAGNSGPAITTDPALLEAPVTFTLVGRGVLELTGTIDPGAAGRFAAEVEKHAEYIRTVALNSPGGSVEDAVAIGRLIRESGFATSVAKGALCASSCPLVFAAGVWRTAAPGAAVGVHQIYAGIVAGAPPKGPGAAGRAMSEAQTTTAEVSRYLAEMGVDPALWVHALETPPGGLYYLTPEEMRAYRLANGPASAPA
jgi:hypothetical protein